MGYSDLISYANLNEINITGNNYVGGIIGQLYGRPLTSVIVEGEVEGNNNVGGIVGYTYYGSSIKGINKGVNVISATNTGRLSGYVYAANVTILGSSLSSATINSSVVSGGTSTNKNGMDIIASDLLNSQTYTSLDFNFTDETQECIWYLDDGIAKFRKGTLFN